MPCQVSLDGSDKFSRTLEPIKRGLPMISLYIANKLKENHDSIIQHWLQGLHGQIAEDYEQMMLTPMGTGCANRLLGLVVGLLESEEYQEPELLRKARLVAREASLRRAAVGFSLADIVTTALTFRITLNDTLMNHVSPSTADEFKELLGAVMVIDRFCDAVVSGEIAGYFASRELKEEGAEADAA